MIKLFRNARKSMIKGNRTTKYLLYAIGEIILVVIGILIALAINNNNEVKKLRKQEVSYLKNLKADIKLELKNNDSIINYRWETAKAAARLLEFKTLETANDVVELEMAINKVFSRIIFTPTNNTYKELLSSGNLHYITNDAIKNELLELDKMYVAINNGEHHMYREYEEYLYNVAIKNGEVLNLLDIQKTAITGIPVFSNPSQISIATVIPGYNRLLKINEFRNGLKLAVMNNIGFKGGHNKMTILLLKLKELIQNDLKNDGNND
ncbi:MULTISPECIES: DUF6090 family protein [unclassified Polaribacter]|uniref:DUF6090 family protein n=1 Tax=unclassified Polaribacter TaxID=196858 RepID=UPI0011BE6BA3|nr:MULTISPECIES: DUF6090 family protein [unclassified Polaribacter]TXD54376.1 hypothetical protein ES043_00555 [Polaribacter sp. IC063]TXD62793.1 hypothetical protein ES044_00205 [Polaribacter sp. IC066]